MFRSSSVFVKVQDKGASFLIINSGLVSIDFFYPADHKISLWCIDQLGDAKSSWFRKVWLTQCVLPHMPTAKGQQAS